VWSKETHNVHSLHQNEQRVVLVHGQRPEGRADLFREAEVCIMHASQHTAQPQVLVTCACRLMLPSSVQAWLALQL
jgi:hypothetical protein